ncbi:hypothetical protein AVEN_185873-1 [Araneus ventricosus]|uniref:Uncharacterized protein n=1 Tax=Araneus ventricosus TaxID=182803 RepID=A0A4Y2CIJ3_ARAVE|nr:hypothetical protein AVEN_107904-1 [Araneus ventricosus]GBM04261.1 hypothetical protein AVEN_185873-1 [Araneus ventricosus]
MHNPIPPKKNLNNRYGIDNVATGFQNCGETRELEQSSIVGANGPIAALGRRENPTPRWYGVGVWKWELQLRYYLRHLSAAQNCKVRPKIAVVLLSKRDVNITKLIILAL